MDATEAETAKMLENGTDPNDGASKPGDDDDQQDSQDAAAAADNYEIANESDTDDVEEEEEDEAPGPLVNHNLPKPMQEIVLSADQDYTPEMFDAATRRAGRAGRRRHKTVSDVSGMFRAPHETDWSHV